MADSTRARTTIALPPELVRRVNLAKAQTIQARGGDNVSQQLTVEKLLEFALDELGAGAGAEIAGRIPLGVTSAAA